MSGSFFYSGSGASHCAGAQEQKPGVTGDSVWGVGQWSMKCVWERGPSHCLMSSQRSLSGERCGSGVSPVALAPTEAPAGHHGTLSSGSSGLPHACASGFRGQGQIPTLLRALTRLILRAQRMSPGLGTPSAPIHLGNPPPNLPLGCLP